MRSSLESPLLFNQPKPVLWSSVASCIIFFCAVCFLVFHFSQLEAETQEFGVSMESEAEGDETDEEYTPTYLTPGEALRVDTVPDGYELFPNVLAPPNYARLANPWASTDEGQYVAPPLGGFVQQSSTTVAIIERDPTGNHPGLSKVVYKVSCNDEPGKILRLIVMEEWRQIDEQEQWDLTEWQRELTDIIKDYDSQVAISFLTFMYSKGASFTRQGGRGAQLQYPRGGKLASAQPNFVRITDHVRKMYTYALLEVEFGEFMRFSNPDEMTKWQLARAADFVRYVSLITSSERWPSPKLTVNVGGFWFRDPSLYLKGCDFFNEFTFTEEMIVALRKSMIFIYRFMQRANIPGTALPEDPLVQSLNALSMGTQSGGSAGSPAAAGAAGPSGPGPSGSVAGPPPLVPMTGYARSRPDSPSSPQQGKRTRMVVESPDAPIAGGAPSPAAVEEF